MNNVYLGVGSNLGNRHQNIYTALEELFPFVELKKLSSIWETSPWGNTEQPYFLNCVALCETNLSAQNLLNKISEIETKMGRQENPDVNKKFLPRIIDIDILFYNNDIINLPSLIVPHPLLHQRKFVLLPLSEIAPELEHPVLKKSIKDLLNSLVSDEKCEIFLKINLDR